MSDGPRRLGGHLDRVLRSLGAPEADTIQQVFERWHEVVGTTLAERTRPIGIDGATLTLAVDEPAVASHVKFLEPQMLERLAELLGPGRVTALHLKVRPK